MVTERPALPSPDPLLDLIHEVMRELQPHQSLKARPGLDQRLDEELGFDSLGLSELYGRLEATYRIRLPDQLLNAVQTPRDLLRALATVVSRDEPLPSAAPRPAPLAAVNGHPETAETLMEVLDWQARWHGDRHYLVLYDDDDQPQEISFAQMFDHSAQIAAGLQQRGIQAGQTVAVMLPTCAEYLFSFFGILLAGGIPVPIYPPVRHNQIDDHLRRHVDILNNAQVRMLVTFSQAKAVGYVLRAQVPTLAGVVTPDELFLPAERLMRPQMGGQDIALLQYTSGSTGTPKGVMLSHANLLANVRAMGRTGQVDSTDVLVSWLPLYHDMGLIGAVFGTLYHAVSLVLMSPLAFINRPLRWLWAMHQHRGTISAAPNFAYELCLRRIDDAQLAELDLSSLRFVVCGAEPVSPETMRAFEQRFAAAGLRPGAVVPVYGLAESSVGLAFSPPGRGVLVDEIQREPFTSQGRAIPVEHRDDPSDQAGSGRTAEGTTPQRFVACGQPLPGHEVRIVDETGREVGERREGLLQFRGPSSTIGYYRNPEETQKLFDGDWLNSGDLAYIVGGDIYLTGREKDVIIRAGRNLYPYELEEVVGDLEGVRKGCVAVFGSPDPRTGTERLVVVAETRVSVTEVRELIAEKIRAVSMDLLGMAPDEVVLAPPHTVLKTSSGKIRRSGTRTLFEQGLVGRRHRAPWLQVVQVALAGTRPQLRRARRLVASVTYGAYWWAVFLAIAAPTWLAVVGCPLRSWAWGIARFSARGVLTLTRISLGVKGKGNLVADAPGIYVCNHTSYLDGLILTLVLPGTPRFVAKSELAGQWLAGPFLRRLGTEFVDRDSKQQGLEDARRIARLAGGDSPLMFFPEGTFTRVPGLRAFKMGAFVAAAEARVPVIPMALRGARSILREGTWLPRQGQLSVEVGELILPEDQDWGAAVVLRDRARHRMLRMTGEPDLAPPQQES